MAAKLLFALAFPLLAAAQPAARIEGQVTSVAGEALPSAALRLEGTPPKNVSYPGATDAAGNFVFENIEPGRYTLSVEASGYVPLRPGRVVNVSAGQVLRDVAIALTPHAVISGKVTDSEANPLGKPASVTAYRRAYVAGHWELRFIQGSSTAADGSFQVRALPAGRYYLSAEETPGPGPEERNVTTYYPGSLDPSTAAPVDVTAGSEARVEIRLRKERVYRIRGQAVNVLTNMPASGVVLGIAPAVRGAVSLAAPRIVTVQDHDGWFEFDRLLPGSYVISTQGGVGPDVSQVAWQAVNVSDVNVDDLILRLTPPAELAGTVRMEGADLGAKPPQVTVGLLADDGLVRNNTSAVRAKNDGTFQVHQVWPNRYQVSVASLPAGTYVKTIRFGSQDITQAGLDLTSGSGGTIEIVLSPEAAAMNGTVKNDAGAPAGGVSVTLWQPGGMARTSVAGRAGGFVFQNLPPGEYRAAAWEQIDSGMANIPEFLSKFESQATSVKLDARGHDTVELKLVKREAVEAEAARLR